MGIKDIITIDKYVLGGKPVFKRTRVLVDTLFDHLEAGVALEQILNNYDNIYF